ncbi:restriction endonuclease subunit S [Microvirgula aerodenitrificans]|uniref:restriction endonuclease subunit S n=1 Tax=Microvirgula aerodenitrificans TaxID=57480 RepID=UPI0028E19678|nr:restriction endonuclease subunit S [Microvirgula aerodenitrificans]
MASEIQWFEKPLGEVTCNHDGKRKPVKESERKRGPYPYYGASGIVDYVDGYIFEGRHLLIAEDGENLRTRQTPIAFIADGRFWVNNHAHIVTGNGEVTTEYLHYFLQIADIQSYLTGAVMPKLTQGNLNRIPVRYPDLEHQKSIVQVLGSLDEKISLNRRINQTLEAMAQAIFKSWFVDFDPVKAKIAAIEQGQDPLRAAMRAISGKTDTELDQMPHEHHDQLVASAALFPDEMEESTLGKIPKWWLVSSLGAEAAYLNRGISPKYTEEGGVLVLNQKCIRDFSIDPSKGRRHDTLQRSVNSRFLQVGDVLVNSTGVGTLGRIGQVLSLNEPMIVDSHVTVVRAGSNLNASFLGQWFVLRQPDIETMGEGSTGQTELSKSKLAEMGILVPGAPILSEFDRVISNLNAFVAIRNKESIFLQKTRDMLLPKLLSGEISLGVSSRMADA